MTADEQLAAARAAWRQLAAAETNLQRLSRYAKPNRAMKADSARSATVAAAARATLQQILGSPPPTAAPAPEGCRG